MLSDIAILEANIPVWVISINGERVSHLGSGNRRQFKLWPGEHEVEVAYRSTRVERAENWYGVATPVMPARSIQSLSNVVLNVSVQAAHSYIVDPGVSTNGWAPAIRELVDTRQAAAR